MTSGHWPPMTITPWTRKKSDRKNSTIEHLPGQCVFQPSKEGNVSSERSRSQGGKRLLVGSWQWRLLSGMKMIKRWRRMNAEIKKKVFLGLVGPLKRPRIKYIGQLARWQILALIPLFFRFPIPQVCPPLEVTPLIEATFHDYMSMVEAVVFISVMLSENTLQQSWSWSMIILIWGEPFPPKSWLCPSISVSLDFLSCGISIVDSTIHHKHHLVLYFATTVIFNREDQNHHQFYNFANKSLQL